jgi:hypothetical protein
MASRGQDAIKNQVEAWLTSMQKKLHTEAAKNVDPASERKAQEGVIERLVRECADATANEFAGAGGGSSGGGRGGGGGGTGRGGASTGGGGTSRAAGSPTSDDAVHLDDDEDDDDDDEPAPQPAAGRGRGGKGGAGRGKAPKAPAAPKPPAAGRGRGRGRGGGARGGGRQTSLNVSGGDGLSDDDMDELDEIPRKSGASKQRAAPAAAASRPKRPKAAARTYDDDEDEIGARSHVLHSLNAPRPARRDTAADAVTERAARACVRVLVQRTTTTTRWWRRPHPQSRAVARLP